MRAGGEPRFVIGSNSFVIRRWFPLLCFSAAFLEFRGSFWSGLSFALPLLLWGFFSFTIAEVRAGEAQLSYRRLFRWRAIAYSEIVGCGIAWMPSVGSLKLRRPLLPWGKLYFVLPGSGFEFAWRGGQTEFTRWVNFKIRGEPVELPVEEAASTEDIRIGKKRCALFAALGFVFMLAFYVTAPGPITPRERSWEGFPTAIRHFEHLWHYVVTWPWGLVTCTVLAVAVLRERFQHRAWLTSFFFGVLLSSVLLQGLDRIFGP